GATTLTANTALNSGSGAITLGALTGSFGLINTSSTGTTLNGAVNIGNLTLSGGCTDTINASSITTNGSQIYNDAIVLGANSTLTANNNGNITFANGISGATRN